MRHELGPERARAPFTPKGPIVGGLLVGFAAPMAPERRQSAGSCVTWRHYPVHRTATRSCKHLAGVARSPFRRTLPSEPHGEGVWPTLGSCGMDWAFTLQRSSPCRRSLGHNAPGGPHCCTFARPATDRPVRDAPFPKARVKRSWVRRKDLVREPRDEGCRSNTIRATEREQGLLPGRPDEPQRVRTDGPRADPAGTVPSHDRNSSRVERAGPRPESPASSCHLAYHQAAGSQIPSAPS